MSDETFAKMGQNYQERVVQALLTDYLFAEQMADVLKPEYFDLKYLQEISRGFFDYKAKYKGYPSIDLLETILTRSEEASDKMDVAAVVQVRNYLQRALETDLNGDKAYIEETSLEFCKKQSLKDGILKAIDMMETGNYDSIQTTIRDALAKGGSRDLGHDYNEGLVQRGQKSHRKPIPTGWPIIDKAFNGGWERATLSTFIAPTGAGKSMFLVNCGAAALAQGLNVLYVTLEMADYKIGLRFDSYFSGIEINDVADRPDAVKAAVDQHNRGRLFVKEFPTKSASVQTLRSYIMRLQATKGFMPDMVVLDYADLLRGSRQFGDKRFELEGTYEELRALAQEMNIVLITADQTNRSGLDMEIVTVAQIGEAYSKATVCDVIMTVSRRMEDKQTNSGRIFLAKSRLGRDGMVYPFLMNPATVKVTMLDQGVDPVALFLENSKNKQQMVADRWQKLVGNGSK